MQAWGSESISTVVGLVTGLTTGLFFERRQTHAARKESGQLREDNAKLEMLVNQLRDQVGIVQTNVTTHLGGRQASSIAAMDRSVDNDISAEILAFVLRRIDASGAVPNAIVFEHFYPKHGAEVVDAGIRRLAEAGKITVDQRTVRIDV